MATQHINVTVPHRLTVEEAAQRFSRPDKPSVMSLLSSMIATARVRKVTAEVEIDIPGPDIPLTVVIAPDRVTFESGPVSRVVEMIGESAITSKFTELFK